MRTVSTRSLNILAAIVWYIGGVVLLLKGRSLLVEAGTLNPQQSWLWLAVITAVFVGGLKARFLFSKSCRKNLNRIAALKEPKIWQFFRPGFFVFLTIMIATGATLSRLAHNNYPFLIGVGILDLSLAVALLGSSIVFWRQKAFAKQHVEQDGDFATR
jgi:hypothetical protein